jgi:hypothetical protein
MHTVHQEGATVASAFTGTHVVHTAHNSDCSEIRLGEPSGNSATIRPIADLERLCVADTGYEAIGAVRDAVTCLIDTYPPWDMSIPYFTTMFVHLTGCLSARAVASSSILNLVWLFLVTPPSGPCPSGRFLLGNCVTFDMLSIVAVFRTLGLRTGGRVGVVIDLICEACNWGSPMIGLLLGRLHV